MFRILTSTKSRKCIQDYHHHRHQQQYLSVMKNITITTRAIMSRRRLLGTNSFIFPTTTTITKSRINAATEVGSRSSIVLLQRSLSTHNEIKNVVTSSSSSSNNNVKHDHYQGIRRNLKTWSYIVASLGIGFGLGLLYQPKQNNHNQRVLPNGLPRTCCDKDHDHDHNDSNNTESSKKNDNDESVPIQNHYELSDIQKDLPNLLRKIVGNENIILDGTKHNTSTLPFLKGARLGLGKALCIVTPTKLHEVIDIVQAVMDANCVILPQGQNTGLTGGSVPRPDNDTRPVVVLSMKKLDRIFPIDNGQRVVCLAGVGLASLQHFLQQYFPNRESHSILGSTFLNPTVAAGIAFGSGGTQCRKGPSYTERALYLKISTNKWNENIIEVINTLGIDGIEENYNMDSKRKRKMDTIAYKLDTWSRWIQEGYVRDMKYSSKTNINGTKPASDHTYAERLCHNKDTNLISRYNADTRGPDCCRSEGKVIILASVHDTFLKPIETKTYWIGFNTLQTALEFRKIVCLDNKNDIPISIEYLDRDSFDIINKSGRLLGTLIKYIGTSSSFIRHFWNIKLYIEALPFRGADTIIDSLIYKTNFIFPKILSNNIMNIGTKYDHNIAITVGNFQNDDDNNIDNNKSSSLEHFMKRLKEFEMKYGTDAIKIYECKTKRENDSITAFRFVAASAFRTYCVGENIQGFSVDYALPMNNGTAPVLDNMKHNENDSIIKPIKRMRYSHFACNVVHEDLAYHNNVNIHHVKHQLKDIIEYQCHGKLPAEHGHGTEYIAPIETQLRWKNMDPLNVLNPGIGGLSSHYKYKE